MGYFVSALCRRKHATETGRSHCIAPATRELQVVPHGGGCTCPRCGVLPFELALGADCGKFWPRGPEAVHVFSPCPAGGAPAFEGDNPYQPELTLAELEDPWPRHVSICKECQKVRNRLPRELLQRVPECEVP